MAPCLISDTDLMPQFCLPKAGFLFSTIPRDEYTYRMVDNG